MKVLLGRRPTNAIIAVCAYLCNCLQLHYEKHILAIYLFSFCQKKGQQHCGQHKNKVQMNEI